MGSVLGDIRGSEEKRKEKKKGLFNFRIPDMTRRPSV